MASVVTSFQSLEQIENAFSALKNAYSTESALTWVQAAFDRTNNGTPAGYSYVSSTRVSARFSNGDTATVYGSNLTTSDKTMSQLDYQFHDGPNVSLLGLINSPASGALSGNITQATLSAADHGTLTLYGNTNVADGNVFLTKSVLDIGDVHYEQSEATNGYIWTNGGHDYASCSSVLSSLSLSIPGGSAEISGLSSRTDSQNFPFPYLDSALGSLLAGNDTLTSTGSKAVLVGKGGDDNLHGETSNDTALYEGPQSNYTITSISGGYRVSDTTGHDGTDTLINVERLQFADSRIALDLDPMNGKAALTAKILGAVFGAASVSNIEYVGIGLHYLDEGMSYADLMKFALDARLGSGFSNADEVALLYSNLVGVQPPADDLNYYVETLTSGQFTQTTLAIMAADLDLNLANINLVGLTQTGLEYF